MRKFLNIIVLTLMLAVFFRPALSLSAQESTTGTDHAFVTAVAVQDTPESQVTVEVTPVPNPEFNDQLAVLESANTAVVERVANAALDRFALWGIAVVLIMGIVSGLGYYLLWKSNPERRSEIKNSAQNQLQLAENQIDKRLVKARETPDITDDLAYGALKGLVDRLEAAVAQLPVSAQNTVMTSGTSDEPGL